MALHAQSYLTEAEYLYGEQFSDIKHEYIHGDLYAMAGASRNHERISRNILTALTIHLKDLRCEPFMSDIKIKADGHFVSFPSSGLGMPTLKLCLTFNAYKCESEVVLFAATPSRAWK